jgi:guanylate kinase
MNSNSGSARLFIISAPSGCGKGTLIKELNREFDIFNSISCTTRSPREGEKDGVHYNFMTKEDFEKLAENGGFLEHACFSGKYYGTPKAPVEENIAGGRDVLLEIEPQGAFQVKEKCPNAVMLFILPPSIASLDRRLHRRAAESGETEEQITARLATAEGDIKRAYDYDYVMMNDDLDEAVADLKKIFTLAKNGGDLSEFAAENRKTMIDEVLENA